MLPSARPLQICLPASQRCPPQVSSMCSVRGKSSSSRGLAGTAGKRAIRKHTTVRRRRSLVHRQEGGACSNVDLTDVPVSYPRQIVANHPPQVFVRVPHLLQ